MRFSEWAWVAIPKGLKEAIWWKGPRRLDLYWNISVLLRLYLFEMDLGKLREDTGERQYKRDPRDLLALPLLFLPH